MKNEKNNGGYLMIFWAMVLFIFGIVLLFDVYNPLLGGFLQPVGPILIMLISIGMLYRLFRRKKATK